jgi:hypothetical protein
VLKGKIKALATNTYTYTYIYIYINKGDLCRVVAVLEGERNVSVGLPSFRQKFSRGNLLQKRKKKESD